MACPSLESLTLIHTSCNYFNSSTELVGISIYRIKYSHPFKLIEVVQNAKLTLLKAKIVYHIIITERICNVLSDLYDIIRIMSVPPYMVASMIYRLFSLHS